MNVLAVKTKPEYKIKIIVRMYKEDEASVLIKFYRDKIIGKPINNPLAPGRQINDIKIEITAGGGYDLYCYIKRDRSNVEMYFTIEKIAEIMGLITPEEVLLLNSIK